MPVDGRQAGAVHVRIAVLAMLLAVGFGLAVVGIALGVDESLTDSGTGASFTVSENSVSFTHGDEQVSAVEEMENVTNVEISAENSELVVETERAEPFGPGDVSQIIDIAQQNETLRAELGDPEAYEYEVEPIYRLNASATVSVESIDVVVAGTDHGNWSAGDGGEQVEFEFVAIEDEGSEGSVRVDREPSYVEDEASVTVSDPETGVTRFTLVVDLDSETVVSVTDWQNANR